MPSAGLSAATLEHFDGVLHTQRDELLAELQQLDASLDDVRTARSGGSSDDENDPEGPTLSSEWSQMSGVHEDFAGKLAEIDSALSRIAEGNFGICARCGERIGRARLDARPSAEFCIDCARALEPRHT
ncbi:TraR/DksA family transcriptional regulator [Luethyella okanaganae]|uniref:TraR/DksA family transcriptional regulator n=1 Tax=Luethyella okanaganae TaxID=69372 RepID=A0ABW1VHP2_9MICO